MEPNRLDEALATIVTELRLTLRTELTSIWLPIQFGAIVLAALIALAIATTIRKRFDLTSVTMGWPPYLRLAARAVSDNFGVIVFIVVLALIRVAFQAAVEHPRIYLLGVAGNLATAWVVIALIASVIRNAFVNRVVAVSAWTIAALNILGLFDTVVAALDARAIAIGGLRLTLLLVIKATIFFLLAFWAANAASNFFERRLRVVNDLTPSIQVLLSKLIRVALLVAAAFFVLGAVGIDLSVLAFFTGAVGLGLGFGLQKIVSNLVSGIILLADKSIKPGDIISVGDQYGWVRTMGARYTAVNTRDGREYLIPNEDFVTQRVVNWTYSDNLIRLEVKFGSGYGHDPRKVQAAAIEAALAVKRVLKHPVPVCHLMVFGPSAVEYRLAFWIADPSAGITAVRSDVMLALWDTLEKEGVGIPKPGPQRVIYERARTEPAEPNGDDLPPLR